MTISDSNITSEFELSEAKHRYSQIEDEIDDLKDEIRSLEREIEDLERDIRRYETRLPIDKDSTISKLMNLVREDWKRFTGREVSIIEQAAEGQCITPEERQRLKLVALRELHKAEL